MSSAADARSDAESPHLTSFNLMEDEERPSSSFAFTSLFDRMRAAFAPSAEPSGGVPEVRVRVPTGSWLDEQARMALSSENSAGSRSAGDRRSRGATDVERAARPRRSRAPRFPIGTPQAIVPLRTVSPQVTVTNVHAVSPSDVPGSPTTDDLSEADTSRRTESGWSLGPPVQSVPGFPLGRDVLDDTRSLATTSWRARSDQDDAMSASSGRPSADAWIRRFRGEGLSRKYWMADETAKECRDCLMPFTPLRRRHHCRICGQIFCHRCASNLVTGERFAHKGPIRTCNQCRRMLQEYDRRKEIDAEVRKRPRRSSDATVHDEQLPDATDLHTPQSEFAAAALFASDPHSLPQRRASDELSDGSSAPSDLDLDDLEGLGDLSASETTPTVDATAPFRSELEPSEGEPAATGFVATPSESPSATSTPLPAAGDEPAEPALRPQLSTAAPAAPSTPTSPIKRSTARQKLMRGPSRFVTSTALGATSLVYFLRMLHQLLLAERLGELQEWKETVKLLALAVIERIRIRVRNTYRKDIRHFVKIKCFPGGRVSDCEFLDGYVCTKNVATKRMATFLPLRHARIMMVAFPIEYHRNASQLMALEPIMAQEYEFLRILVARIVALRPNVVIAERSVSHLALRMFEDAGVVVFCGMKRTAIETIAHCTQADIVQSIDRLALDPHLGRCACLSVDSYAYTDDPERRKPLLRVEVVSKEVSSGLILRGASLPRLRRVKAILALMVFVGYNLKLEEYARRDMGAALDWSVMNIYSAREHVPGGTDDDDAHMRIVLDETLKKYQRLILSASIPVVFPLPYLVTHMKHVVDRIHMLRTAPAVEAHHLYTTTADGTPLQPLSALGDAALSLRAPDGLHGAAELARLEAEQDAIRTGWRACISRMSKMLTPFAHQQLTTLVSKTCSATLQTCTGPSFHTAEYYGPGDEPLGQFLERVCSEAGDACGARGGCESANLLHYTTFVHNTMRVQMVTERFACPMPGHESAVLCWSYCKLCEATTPVTRMCDESWSLSFAKFLELQFYPNASCHTSMCTHDYFLHTVRYFALQNLAIRFHADTVEPWKVVVPPPRLVFDVQLQCENENAEVLSLFDKNRRYWQSLTARLGALRTELQTGAIYATSPLAKVQSVAQGLLAELERAALADAAEIERHLVDTYWASRGDLLAMNDVRRTLQDKVVEWDALFFDFEKHSSVSERELRRLTAQYRKREGDELSTETELDTPGEKRGLELLSLLELWGTGEKKSERDDAHDSSSRTSATSSREGSVLEDVVHHEGTRERLGAVAAPVAAAACTVPTAVKSAALQSAIATKHAQKTGEPGVHEDGVDLAPGNAVKTSEEPRPGVDASPRHEHTAPEPASLAPPPDALAVQAPHALPPALPAPHPVTPARPSPQHDAPLSQSTDTRPPASPPPHRLSTAAPPSSQPASCRLSTSSPTRTRSPQKRRNDQTMRLTRPPNQSFSKMFNHRGEQMLLRPPWNDARAQPSTQRHKPTQQSQVSILARQFEQMSRDAEESPANRLRRARARPVTTTHATVEVFKNLRDAVKGDESDTEEDVRVSKDDLHSSGARRGAAWLGEDAHRASRLRTRAGVPRRNSAVERTPRHLSPLRRPKRSSEQSLVEIHHDAAASAPPCECEPRGEHADADGAPRLSTDISAQAPLLAPALDVARAKMRSAKLPDQAPPESATEQVSVESARAPLSASEPAMPHAASTIDSATAHEAAAAPNRPTLRETPATPQPSVTRTRPAAPDAADTSAAPGPSNAPGTPASSDPDATLQAPDTPRASSHDSPSSRHTHETTPTRLFHELESTWRLHSGELAPLEYPFRNQDHVFSDSRVVVREDEPSSIIAFTLNSRSYREQLRASHQGASDRNLQDELHSADGMHYLHEFDTGTVKIWCKIFFAEQFEALRQLCRCSEAFVPSLSRCFKWDSLGGKSGSAFLKTRDDRFVVKQLSRAELDGFSKFAPQYFAYVTDCMDASRPTALTKLFGYYRIGFRNAHTGKSFKMDMVVMENLLYGRQVSKIFDLKGSTRHRFVHETERPHEVLLDENLLQYSQTMPLLVREHSKRVLRTALYNDSLFLTELNVMDYSLIMALDHASGEMTIGIIDYLRTYTWDKRVESFVKETAILGAGGKGEPTIITPRQYRMRFMTFLDRHLLMTPDPWMQPGWVQ